MLLPHIFCWFYLFSHQMVQWDSSWQTIYSKHIGRILFKTIFDNAAINYTTLVSTLFPQFMSRWSTFGDKQSCLCSGYNRSGFYQGCWFSFGLFDFVILWRMFWSLHPSWYFTVFMFFGSARFSWCMSFFLEVLSCGLL